MMQNVHFRLTSVAQKRCCLSSLISGVKSKVWPASKLSDPRIPGSPGRIGRVPGGYSGFQATGIIKWGQKSKPPKIPGPKFNPQKSPCRIPSQKNFQRNYAAGIRGNYHDSSDCFEYPKNHYLNQAAQKKYLP